MSHQPIASHGASGVRPGAEGSQIRVSFCVTNNWGLPAKITVAHFTHPRFGQQRKPDAGFSETLAENVTSPIISFTKSPEHDDYWTIWVIPNPDADIGATFRCERVQASFGTTDGQLALITVVRHERRARIVFPGRQRLLKLDRVD